MEACGGRERFGELQQGCECEVAAWRSKAVAPWANGRYSGIALARVAVVFACLRYLGPCRSWSWHFSHNACTRSYTVRMFASPIGARSEGEGRD